MAAKRTETIGFIGLGAMGGGMAANVLGAGFPVVVHDIDDEKNRRLAGLGAEVAGGAAEVARKARTVVTMVDTTAQSRDVIAGPGGLVDGAEAGDLVVCMSTIEPTAIVAMHEQLGRRGVRMIESPVTGMIKGATDGTLHAFVGGDAADLEAARPVLEAMTSEIVHVGRIGQGVVLKLINNMLYKINSIAAIEGMVLGAKAGLDPQLMYDVISRSTGDSPAFRYRAKRIIERDFDGVRLDISCKDLALERGLGSELRVPLFLQAACSQVFEMGRAAGLGDRDATALVTVYEQLTGVVVGGTTD